MRSWLTALRIARREASRAKGRSALVIALIALPVFALTFLAVSYDSFRLSPDQEVGRDLGAADALLDWRYQDRVSQSPDARVYGPDGDGGPRDEPVTAAELAEVVDPATRIVPRHMGRLEVHTPHGQTDLHTEWLDLDDPIHAGRVILQDGRAPGGDREVALTRGAAQRLDAAIGDEVSTADGSERWTVTGIAEFPYRFESALLLPARDTPAREWLIATESAVTWDQVRELNEHGIVVRSREVLLNPPPPSEVDPAHTAPRRDDAPVIAAGALIAGLALLEVVLLAGPAFAVSARRRQRQLGLVAASGGTPAHLRRIVLADGIVLGTAGALVGVTLGVVAALGLLPVLEHQLMGRRAGGVRLFPLALAGAAAIAVITGLAAALVPAATAARQHVITALSGRRGVTRSRRRWLVLGLVVTGCGAALAGAGAWQIDTALVLAGLILAQVGLVLCTPAMVGLAARLGPHLPLAPRIALRDTARNRAAAAPAISAVMAAVTGAVALGIFLTASEQRSHGTVLAGLPVGNAAVTYHVWEEGSPSQVAVDRDQVRAAVAAALPDASLQEVDGPRCAPGSGDNYCRVTVPVPPERECPARAIWEEQGGVPMGLSAEQQRQARQDPRCQEVWQGWRIAFGPMVDDGKGLEALIGGNPDDLAAAAATLRRGGVVVTDPDRVVDGQVTLEVSRHDQTERADGDWFGELRVDEVTVPGYALTTGEHVSFPVISPGALAEAGLAAEPYALILANPDVPTEAQQDALRQRLATIHPNLYPSVETGPVVDEDPFLLVLGLVAAVVALAAAGIATGLAAADRQPDLATLGAVGASPRVRRALSASQSGVIAGLGAVLGTTVGLGSAYTVLIALNQAEAHVWPINNPPYQLVFPWPELALLVVVLPAVAMLGAWLLTRSRLPIERRT